MQTTQQLNMQTTNIVLTLMTMCLALELTPTEINATANESIKSKAKYIANFPKIPQKRRLHNAAPKL